MTRLCVINFSLYADSFIGFFAESAPKGKRIRPPAYAPSVPSPTPAQPPARASGWHARGETPELEDSYDSCHSTHANGTRRTRGRTRTFWPQKPPLVSHHPPSLLTGVRLRGALSYWLARPRSFWCRRIVLTDFVHSVPLQVHLHAQQESEEPTKAAKNAKQLAVLLQRLECFSRPLGDFAQKVRRSLLLRESQVAAVVPVMR